MAGENCIVDSDCPAGEVCIDGVCVSREGWQRCQGYNLQEYRNGEWVTIEKNSPQCGYSGEPKKDFYYYDLYNRGGNWVNAAAEYLSKITAEMSMAEKYQIYVEIYYKYVGGGGGDMLEPGFPWRWLIIGGGVAAVIALIVATRKK